MDGEYEYASEIEVKLEEELTMEVEVSTGKAGLAVSSSQKWFACDYADCRKRYHHVQSVYRHQCKHHNRQKKYTFTKKK